MDDLISFVIQVKKPRREYVGLRMAAMPADYLDFISDLEEAAGLGFLKHSARYGVKPKWMRILVQRGKSRISQLPVSMVGGKLRIQSWNINHESPLYEVYLQWRFLRHGRVLAYYEKLDRPEKWRFNFERTLFRDTPIGLPTEEQVMRDESSKPVLPVSQEDAILEKIRAQVFRVG